MNRKKTICLICLLALLFGNIITFSQRSAEAALFQSMSRYIIGSGGGSLAGRDYSLDTTFGQPVAGIVSAELCSGFWCGTNLPLIISPNIYLPLITH